MIHSVATLEGMACEIHEATGSILPVDAFWLAQRCKLELRAWAKGYGALRGTTVWYPSKARHTRQHGIIAHEIGHFAQRRAALEDCEGSARYLAGALLLPRAPFLRDAEALDLDLFELMARHPNASGEMIAARLTQVMPATAWVWDCGHVTRQYGLSRPPPVNVIDEALELEAPVRTVDGSAWPLLDRHHRRVIVVCRAA